MFIRIGTAVISYVNSTDSFKLSNYVPEIQYKGLEDQKNWSPFMYKTNILFIQSINPLNVISIEYVQNSMKAKSKVFSFHEFVNGNCINIIFFIIYYYIYLILSIFI